MACAGTASLARAQSGPFAAGWDLLPQISTLNFQSIKTTADGTLKVESNGFATYSGAIAPDGSASIEILLDSVDTKVDLRNVRMRFLFFETFKFPKATATLQLTPEMVADLAEVKRKTLTLPFTLSLHGVEVPMSAELAVTLIDADTVSVATAVPISVPAAPFGLADNVTKLEQAVGGITIVPSGTVTFDFRFARHGSATPAPAVAVDAAPAAPAPAAAATAAPVPPAPAAVALEPQGEFSAEACIGRFEILSRTGNIYFRTASAQLQPDSLPLLASLLDIVRRCPDMHVEIAGHTDSDGADATNQALSEARARAVLTYLTDQGIPAGQLSSTGFGESRPVAPNDSARNKALNRRIEFSASAR